MGEFFKGWRRKVGLLTLVIALLFMGGWVRSLYFVDMLVCSNGRIPTICLGSADSSLIWAIDYQASLGKDKYPQYLHTRLPAEQRIFKSPNIDWQWHWCGFGSGVSNEREILSGSASYFLAKCMMTVIPYWSIVLPLTLISVCLLLSKPRKSNQGKIDEPIPEKVA